MTYYIGIDIAKYKHDCFIMDHDGAVACEPFTFANDAEGFAKLSSVLGSLDPSQEKRIGFEATGHYGSCLMAFLDSRGFSFMEINPILVKRFSSATTLRRTKTDKADAALIASYLASAEYAAYPVKSYHIRSLKSLTRARDALVGKRSQQLVAMTNILDRIFPEFKPFFGNSLKSSTALYLLENYSTPSRMARMNRESYEKMSRKLRRTISYARFVELRELAKNTVGSEDDCAAFELGIHIDVYRNIDANVGKLESFIGSEYEKLGSHIHTVKGIGTISAATIYAEYGGISNFETAGQMLAFAGLDASRNESGEHSYAGRMVKHGSPHLRRVLLNCAESVVIHNPVFYDYYRKKRAEGKHHRVALTHVARKLVRIIFCLEKNGVDFDPGKLR